MKIEIEIPEEFENHFNHDRFKDSFERILADIEYSLKNGDCLCTGSYEYETIEMLKNAFENSKQRSDLISRSKLIDYFYFGIDDKPIIDCISDRKIIDIIKNQPTAYDIDKVVEELEEQKHMTALDGDDADLYKEAINDAIEIVKQGGVSDVCVWERVSSLLYPKCRNLDNTSDNSMDEDCISYTYCPYCEKKIKVVE